VSKPVRLVVIAAAILFVVLQLVPKRVSNPAVRAEPPWDSPATRQLAVTACSNCHSNRTHLAWFEHVAPLSWWIAGHVDEGRNKLNFSEYDPNHHGSGQKIAKEVEDGKMPPGYYTWFRQHGEAKLSDADRAALIKGLTATFGPAVGVREGGGNRGPGGG
jgi:mono/diheme cytochrome c family protein